MNLSRKDYEFNNTRICHVMPKQIELDRTLIGLYMLLKYDGHRPVARTGRIEVTINYIVEQLIQHHSDTLIGFRDHQEVVKDWVYSDLVDVVYRGIPGQETVAAPLPLHLNAYKLRNPKQAQDYRSAEHLFSLLRAGEPGLVKRLANFLGQGMDPANYDTYDEETPLDLDTLTIVRMVDNQHLQEQHSSRGKVPEPPLCVGQARLLCSDLRRLLVYESVIPRPVLIGYIRAIFGLHLGLYLLRLFRQLTGWVSDCEAHPTCLNCPVHPDQEQNAFGECPYAWQNPATSGNASLPELLVDMGEDYATHMAQLSRDNCAQHFASMNDYILSVFTVNQLFRFADSHAGHRVLKTQPDTVADVLKILSNPPEGFDFYFSQLIDNIVPNEDEERDEVKAVKNMQGLTSMETFIELVALDRTRYYRKYLTQQLDSVLMKNKDTGLLRDGKSRRNGRRWHIGSRMLETLVQIAVLEPKKTTTRAEFRSRPILIDQFIRWLRQRYGLVLIPDWPDATIQDYEAFNTNLHHLKVRLREIGFYTDLSDAYNAQTIRPRYEIG